MSPYVWKILEWDGKPQINKQTKQNMLICLNKLNIINKMQYNLERIAQEKILISTYKMTQKKNKTQNNFKCCQYLLLNTWRLEPYFFVVCLCVYVTLENFSRIWRCHHCRWRAANVDLCSALMAIESEGSLTGQTCCDTGLPFKIVISEDPWH